MTIHPHLPSSSEVAGAFHTSQGRPVCSAFIPFRGDLWTRMFPCFRMAQKTRVFNALLNPVVMRHPGPETRINTDFVFAPKV